MDKADHSTIPKENAQKYWAFISYSSKDKKWGQWLHRRLESYPIPKSFQGNQLFDGAVLGKNLRPIFRDRDELAGSAELGPAIARALGQTRFLVVLCSKNSAKSQWVNKEIEDFKARGKEKYILALILDGVPNATSNPEFNSAQECFPPALRYPAEPLAGDLRKEGDGKERGFLKILSGVAQLDFDALYRRHERDQQKRRTIGALAGVTLILVLSLLTTFAFRQKHEADRQRRSVQTEKETQTKILWQDSLNAWAAAEEAYQSGQARDALAQLAVGMKSAPSNTRLVPFAISILEEIDHGLREIRLDRPLLGISQTASGIITAEAEFSDQLHFHLRDRNSFEVLATAAVPQVMNANTGDASLADGEELKEALRKHPWLSDASWSFQNAPWSIGTPSISQYGLSGFDADGGLKDTNWIARSVWNTAGKDRSNPWYWYVPGSPSETSAGWKTGYEKHDVIMGRGFAINIVDSIEPRLAPLKDSGLNEKPIRLALSSMYIGKEPGRSVSVGSVQIAASPAGSLSVIGSDQVFPLGEFSGTFLASFDPRASILAVFGHKKGSEQPSVSLISAKGFLILEEPLNITEFYHTISQLVFGPGPSLFVASDDKLFYWPELRPGMRLEKPIPAQVDQVGWLGSAALSPDGKTLALGYKRQLMLLQVPELELIRPPIYHQSVVSALKFSADGKSLISSSGFNDGSGSAGYAQIWRFPEMERIGSSLEMVIPGSQYNTSSPVKDIEISRDGSAIALGSSFGGGSSLRIWDIKTALPLSAFINSPTKEAFRVDSIKEFKIDDEISLTVEGRTELVKGLWRYNLILPSEPVPAWFYEAMIPYLANQRISETGQRKELRPEDFTELYSRLQQVAEQEGSNPYTEIMFRFLPSLDHSRR